MERNPLLYLDKDDPPVVIQLRILAGLAIFQEPHLLLLRMLLPLLRLLLHEHLRLKYLHHLRLLSIRRRLSLLLPQLRV
jgi:hypothetical protein